MHSSFLLGQKSDILMTFIILIRTISSKLDVPNNYNVSGTRNKVPTAQTDAFQNWPLSKTFKWGLINQSDNNAGL